MNFRQSRSACRKWFFLTGLLFIFLTSHAQSSTEKVTVLDDKILVPNAFSPNGDGMNDKFRFFATDDVIVESFIILNRFGQIVFQAADAGSSWDGTYKNIECPKGSYFYMISYYLAGEAGIESKRGSITLLR